MSINIIGISALYHDSACCILQNGELKAAVQEERFSRRKNDASIPGKAFLYCLEAAGLTLTDIDCVAYYENPEKKLARQLWAGIEDNSPATIARLDPHRPQREIREVLGYDGPIHVVDHHLSHAASSFFFSGFESSAILTVDGVGEWATTTYGLASGPRIELFEEVHFPDSLGLLYSTITSYLGFKVNSGEYKVMGLAPYGVPKYADQVRKLLRMGKEGQYHLDLKYFGFLQGERMYSEELIGLLGQPPRQPEAQLTQFHKDVARSMQVVLEETLLQKVRYLHRKTGAENLCMAGGVALNCVANGRVLREGPFTALFVQPAANDAGGALGAAALAHAHLTGQAPGTARMEHVYLGPSYAQHDVTRLLQATSIKAENFQGRTHELLGETARQMAAGKVVGWFHGRMEFGPRSLGARSILADPRDPQMRDRINAMVKKREGFRPFAPAVLEREMARHFDLDHPSPFMLETCQVISPLDLPAITHADGSARVQSVDEASNPRFAHLLEAFNHLTGCPILLNTSFNVRGEPIVCSPEDALKCFIRTDIDCLVLEDFLIRKEDNSTENLRSLLEFHEQINESEITPNVYTFL